VQNSFLGGMQEKAKDWGAKLDDFSEQQHSFHLRKVKIYKE
jgi:hypothetical protein